MADPYKNCKTCGHKEIQPYLGDEYWQCNLSGYYCSTEREALQDCDEDYSGWIPIPLTKRQTIVKKIKAVFRKLFYIEVDDETKKL